MAADICFLVISEALRGKLHNFQRTNTVRVETFYSKLYGPLDKEVKYGAEGHRKRDCD